MNETTHTLQINNETFQKIKQFNSILFQETEYELTESEFVEMLIGCYVFEDNQLKMEEAK